MYLKVTTSRGHSYLQLVESYRQKGKAKQKILQSLGRLDVLTETGQIDRLILAFEKYSTKLAVIGEIKNSSSIKPIIQKHIGSVIVFERLWKKLGIDKVINNLVKNRKFQFSVERVIFMTVLQRLISPSSDRAACRWVEDYMIPDLNKIELQHCYRTMAWLGEALPDEEQYEQRKGYSYAVRSTKDVLEEDIFDRRRNLFTGLSLVFFDTTSIYFEGKGGEDLGKRGHSKDHRPDLNQIVVGMILDNEGRPICTEMWHGNTADVTTLVPVAERLKKRFYISNICLVADRGMISAATKNIIKGMGWSYILGVRMRQIKEVKENVVTDQNDFEIITKEREKQKDPSPLKVKEVFCKGTRYIVCKNEEQARKDKYDREKIVESLKKAISEGDKTLIGNKGFRKFVKGSDEKFTIDLEKIKDDEIFDGLWVLTTNLTMPMEQVAFQYKNLLLVESIFRASKSLLDTRPIFHKRDETIRGHIWCSYLALLLRKELLDAVEKSYKNDDDPHLEWDAIINDLEHLQYCEATVGNKKYLWRTDAKRGAVKAFTACGIQIPKILKEIQSI